VALAINNGDYLVGYLTTDLWFDRAYLYATGAVTELGTLGGNYSYALAINNSNVVVGGSFIDTNDTIYHAFVWDGSTMIDLNTLMDSSGAGWTLLDARAINDRGQIVGVGTLAGVRRAYLLTPGQPIPGGLVVSPAVGLNTSSTVGGPFSPSSILYTLTNSGSTSLDWTASKSQNWVSLNLTSGTLATGASTTVTVSINSNANLLAAGSYSDSVTFANATAGQTSFSARIELVASPIGLSLTHVASSDEYWLTLRGQPYRTYVIDASSNLAQWSAIATNTTGLDGSFAHRDAAAPQMPSRFYRARPDL
jgi:probable HAF family extracellular repeat protein